jgi:hypothetical protein
VNGTALTGSAALRANTIFKTFLANGNVGQFASALNASTTVTGRAGGLLARNGFPDNFIVVNPQYASVAIAGNPSSSTYHAMTLQVTKRLSQGFTQQFAYTWSRTLSDIGAGDNSTEYLDLRNRQLNHTLQAFHRTQDVRTNGTFELPFGPARKFLANAPGFLSRIVERWQFGTIFSWSSGAPITITASNAELSWSQAPQTINLTRTPNTPNILGAFPKDIGKLTYTSNGGYYFSGYTQVTDSSINNVTPLQTLQNSFSNKAFADANGKIVLANPAPGIVGTLGRQWIEGPAHANLDVNLVKRIRLGERKEFEMRVDVVNIMNNPRWSLVSSDINSTNFGILTAADPANRRFTFSTRLNF